jgi:hypothetical protein
MRTCIEVEANFKAIFRENIYTVSERNWNIDHFKKVNKTHHLDDYSVEIPFWGGDDKTKSPFRDWKMNQPLSWYRAYNKLKHDRLTNFQEANFGNLINAYAALFVLLSSQFGTESFSPGNGSIQLEGGRYGIGGFLIANFPDNWAEDEMYEFDWTELRAQSERFEKINYDNL